MKTLLILLILALTKAQDSQDKIIINLYSLDSLDSLDSLVRLDKLDSEDSEDSEDEKLCDLVNRYPYLDYVFNALIVVFLMTSIPMLIDDILQINIPKLHKVNVSCWKCRLN